MVLQYHSRARSGSDSVLTIATLLAVVMSKPNPCTSSPLSSAPDKMSIPVNFSEVKSNGRKYKKVQEKLDSVVTTLPKRHAIVTKNNRHHKRSSSRRRKNKPSTKSSLSIMLASQVSASVTPEVKLFLYKNWDGDNKPDPPVNRAKVHNIDDYIIVDNIGSIFEDIIVLDRSSNEFIVGKSSVRKSQSIGGKAKSNDLRKLMKRILAEKPNVHRGDKNSGENSHYSCFGYRKDPLASGKLGEYSYKQGTTDVAEKEISDKISELVQKMEEVGGTLTSQLPEHRNYEVVKEMLVLPSVGRTRRSIATQFSVGQNYWSQTHADIDYFFTMLSCLSAKAEDKGKIMYYFCYPEYKIAVAMCSGDLIVFNPLKQHSCSNCRLEDSFIFSAYVSSKTVMTAGIGIGLDSEINDKSKNQSTTPKFGLTMPAPGITNTRPKRKTAVEGRRKVAKALATNGMGHWFDDEHNAGIKHRRQNI